MFHTLYILMMLDIKLFKNLHITNYCYEIANFFMKFFSHIYSKSQTATNTVFYSKLDTITKCRSNRLSLSKVFNRAGPGRAGEEVCRRKPPSSEPTSCPVTTRQSTPPPTPPPSNTQPFQHLPFSSCFGVA